ncbi:MAG: efflux RND transporter periplasmic adaptor subunit, partial [Candidatus Latescibacteria bacterium]|nr:efflux RND transporter periplasmic adaptor subunit [Candidatus Latescibacterota bacterium]
MRRTLKLAVVVLAMIGISGIVGCGKEEKAGREEFGATPVRMAEVVRGDISTVISLTGDIEPWRQVNIVPDLPGKVARIYVEEGDKVKQGQLLAELDTRTAKLGLQQAEAGLAVAQANLHSASKDWERIQKLHQKGTISPQQYEKVQLGYGVAKAQLQQAEAALDMAKHQLEVSLMKAPFDGVITGKNINEGEYINPAMGGMGPGGSSVVTLMDLSKVKIKVNISEKDMKRVLIGQETRITVDAYPGKEFYGKVSKLNPTADPMSRTFKVEIAVPNKEMVLKAGMYARVKLSVVVHKDVLLVPEKGMLEQQGRFLLFVADGDVARMREVKPGLSSEGMVEIVDGV